VGRRRGWSFPSASFDVNEATILISAQSIFQTITTQSWVEVRTQLLFVASSLTVRTVLLEFETPGWMVRLTQSIEITCDPVRTFTFPQKTADLLSAVIGTFSFGRDFDIIRVRVGRILYFIFFRFENPRFRLRGGSTSRVR